MPKRKKELIIIFCILIIIFILKLVLSVKNIYAYDIKSFAAWSLAIAQEGIAKSYQVYIPPSLSPVNYPPGAIYIFASLGWLAITLLDLNTTLGKILFLELLKTPAILFDLATALAIFCFFRKKYSFEKALFPFMFYLLNITVWFNSSLWGGVDSWHTFFLLLSLYFLTEDKYLKSSFLITLALMLKPQALIFLPLVFLFILLQAHWKETLKAIAVSAGTAIVIILPWLVAGKNIFLGYLGYYTRLSSLAFNLWYLLFGYASIQINDQNKILFFLNYRYLGLGLFALVYALLAAFLIYLKIKNPRFLKRENYLLTFMSAVIIGQAFFLFCTEIHERYLFQIMPLVLMLYYLHKEMKNFYLYFMLTIFLNAITSLLIIEFQEEKPTITMLDYIGQFFSALNILVFFIFIYYFRKIYKEKIKDSHNDNQG